MNRDRRRLLAAGAGLAASAALGCGSARRPGDDWVERLTGLAAGDDAFRVVARRYLDTHPDERTPAALIAALGFDPAAPELGSGDALLDRVAAAVRADVDGDRLVPVDRWLLSRSEARLFTLAYLWGTPAQATWPPSMG